MFVSYVKWFKTSAYNKKKHGDYALFKMRASGERVSLYLP